MSFQLKSNRQFAKQVDKQAALGNALEDRSATRATIHDVAPSTRRIDSQRSSYADILAKECLKNPSHVWHAMSDNGCLTPDVGSVGVALERAARSACGE